MEKTFGNHSQINISRIYKEKIKSLDQPILRLGIILSLMR